MLLAYINKFIRRRQRGVAARGLRLCAAVMFASLFAMSAENVYAVSSYSDVWVDNSNPSAGHIVASGVTRSAYNYRWSAIHEVEVETTLTSPRGRSVTAEGEGFPHSNYGPMTARAEVVLAWNWNDMGRYTIRSRHYSECPEVEFGTTSTSGTAGYSRICYRYDHYDPDSLNPWVYKIVDGCASRISCYNSPFYSFYNVGMRAKSAQGYFTVPYTNYKICTAFQQPLIGGACEGNYCQDVDVINVP